MVAKRLAFGRDVFGPIFAEFALRLWIYLNSLAHPEQTSLLFCARGGLRLQLLFERFLAASGLDHDVRSSALMVSRVVAVRAALLADADCAYEQVGYEFSEDTLLDVARAISGLGQLDLSGFASADDLYTREGFRALLASEAGRPVLREIQVQDKLFRAHLAAQSEGRERIILCDTGLFGSTLQLLKNGMPELCWSAAMVARANYKRLAAPHFDQTVGLLVEADHYSPWRTRTSLLRYWQMVEGVLEPVLPSVKTFSGRGESVVSNLEVDGWQAKVLPEPDSVFAGVLEYIDDLKPPSAPRVLREANLAWGALHRAIVWPRAEDGDILDMGSRSDDFGLDSVCVPRTPGPFAALRGRSMWREGEIARSGSLLRAPLLAGLETAHVLRWARRSLRA